MMVFDHELHLRMEREERRRQERHAERIREPLQAIPHPEQRYSRVRRAGVWQRISGLLHLSRSWHKEVTL